MKHTIVVPDPRQFDQKDEIPLITKNRIYRYQRPLLLLDSYFTPPRPSSTEIEVIVDHDLVQKRMPPRVHVGNGNATIPSFFLVNDELFMIIETDRPSANSKQWIPYYAEKVRGFFLLCHRFSMENKFKKIDVPVFPIAVTAGRFNEALDIYMETVAHSKSLNCSKDISVFFRGRWCTRIVRKTLGQSIRKSFHDAHITFVSYNGGIPWKEYIDLLCRSKISWCPRSVKCPSDPECNCVTSRESDAMCLETLVVRPPIGIYETEERIDGVHFVEVRNDNADLIEKLRYYLEHDEEREQISRNGRLYWERNNSMIAQARTIFNNCMQALNCKDRV